MEYLEHIAAREQFQESFEKLSDVDKAVIYYLALVHSNDMEAFANSLQYYCLTKALGIDLGDPFGLNKK